MHLSIFGDCKKKWFSQCSSGLLQEAEVVVGYVKDLLSARGIRVNDREIGVITPYRKQVSPLCGGASEKCQLKVGILYSVQKCKF